MSIRCRWASDAWPSEFLVTCVCVVGADRGRQFTGGRLLWIACGGFGLRWVAGVPRLDLNALRCLLGVMANAVPCSVMLLFCAMAMSAEEDRAYRCDQSREKHVAAVGSSICE
jgi:hypothetical protein